MPVLPPQLVYNNFLLPLRIIDVMMLFLVSTSSDCFEFVFFAYFLILKTKLYTEDWIGLKTLDKAGRVKFISVKGGHLNISDSDVKKYIVPYLNGGAQVETDSRLDRYIKTRRLLH